MMTRTVAIPSGREIMGGRTDVRVDGQQPFSIMSCDWLIILLGSHEWKIIVACLDRLIDRSRSRVFHKGDGQYKYAHVACGVG